MQATAVQTFEMTAVPDTVITADDPPVLMALPMADASPGRPDPSRVNTAETMSQFLLALA